MARKALLLCGILIFAALCRHERLCSDAVGGLQLRLSNGQPAVRGRRVRMRHLEWWRRGESNYSRCLITRKLLETLKY